MLVCCGLADLCNVHLIVLNLCSSSCNFIIYFITEAKNDIICKHSCLYIKQNAFMGDDKWILKYVLSGSLKKCLFLIRSKIQSDLIRSTKNKCLFSSRVMSTWHSLMPSLNLTLWLHSMICCRIILIISATLSNILRE